MRASDWLWALTSTNMALPMTLLGGAARPVYAQLHQLAGLGIGQRPEQDGIDHAEDGGVCPDAEREREHGDGGEAGILQQLAEGEF